MHSDRRRRLWFAALILAVIIAILYLRGVFDAELYRFGLNHYPCTHQLNGRVVCGQNVVGTPY